MPQTSPQLQQDSMHQKERTETSEDSSNHLGEPAKPMQDLSLDPFTFTHYAGDNNTPSTQAEAEAELWRFMTSIMPSEHQEMMHLQEGAWCQNKHANNTERFIQPEMRATRKMPLQDKTAQQH